MYNAEVKERFLRSFTNSIASRRVAASLFNSLEQYEQEWGRDICTQGINEINRVLRQVCGVRASGKYTRYRLMQSYFDWCISQQIPGAKPIALDPWDTGTEKYRTGFVASPMHLQHYLDLLFKPESLESKDDTYRCLCWLAFGGILEIDACDVTGDEVDFNRMLVSHNDTDYPIYREGLQAIRNCVKLDSFKYYHANGSLIRVTDRTPGNQLLRGTSGTFNYRMFLCLYNDKVNDKYTDGKSDGMKVSYENIWLSGIFYRLHELERMGVRIDVDAFVPVLEDKMKGRARKNPEKSMPTHNNIRSRAHFLYQDYLGWKQAFSTV